MLSLLASLAHAARVLWHDAARAVAGAMPKGLFARSLLIVILPMLILQLAVAYFFMERHWQLVTYRLSTALTQDIAALVDTYTANPSEPALATLRRIASERQNLDVSILPNEDLPRALPKPFFSLIDPLNRALSASRSGLTRSAAQTSSKSASSLDAT
jgi:two-component system, OmpR family, osmolarity sensor histidine kinase EnvZ